MFQLWEETLQFEIHKIKQKASPIDFRKVWHYETHAKFPLVDIVQVAIRIAIVLCK